MTQTELKATGRIGAELGAAKAENDNLRRLLADIRRHNSSGLTKDMQARIDAALAEPQGEPAKPIHPSSDVWPEWANWCGLDPSGCWVFYELEPVTSSVGRTPSGGSWGSPIQDEPQTCWQVMIYPRNSGKQAEPAPAQDELRKRFDQIEDEVARGKHTAASVFTQMRTAALYIRPAQTEQQPVAWMHSRSGAVATDATKRAMEDGSVPSGYDVPLYAAPVAQPAPQPEQSGMMEALRMAVEYLDSNDLNSIASGSTCHRKMRNALAAQGGER